MKHIDTVQHVIRIIVFMSILFVGCSRKDTNSEDGGSYPAEGNLSRITIDDKHNLSVPGKAASIVKTYTIRPCRKLALSITDRTLYDDNKVVANSIYIMAEGKFFFWRAELKVGADGEVVLKSEDLQAVNMKGEPLRSPVRFGGFRDGRHYHLIISEEDYENGKSKRFGRVWTGHLNVAEATNP